MRPTSALSSAFLRPTSVCCLFSLLLAVLIGSGAQLVDAKPSSANQLRHRRNLPSNGGVPSVGNCTGCIDRRTMADLRIEQIKKELLEKLGFQRVPQVQPSWGSLPPIGRNNPTVARLLREASHGQAGGRQRDGYMSEEPYLEEEEEQRPEKTYVFARKSPPRYELADDLAVGYFEFSASTMAKELKNVDLEVYLRKPTSEFDEEDKVELSIDVYERLRNGQLSDTPIAHKKLPHYLSRERYVRISLPVDVIRKWFDDELEKAGKDDTLGLFVSASFGDENLAEHPQDGDENAMYLELTTVERSSGRSKRNARGSCSSEKEKARQCCLYDLEIDFEKAGWDFVIAPKRYNAYMCNGECHIGDLARYPHTKIATQHAIVSGQSGVGPCCHPTEYDAITLIYMTEEREVLISKVTGMIARRCGCA